MQALQSSLLQQAVWPREWWDLAVLLMPALMLLPAELLPVLHATPARQLRWDQRQQAWEQLLQVRSQACSWCSWVRCLLLWVRRAVLLRLSSMVLVLAVVLLHLAVRGAARDWPSRVVQVCALRSVSLRPPSSLLLCVFSRPEHTLSLSPIESVCVKDHTVLFV